MTANRVDSSIFLQNNYDITDAGAEEICRAVVAQKEEACSWTVFFGKAGRDNAISEDTAKRLQEEVSRGSKSRIKF